MRKQIFIRIIPFLLLCMLPFKLHSQTTVLSQSFKNIIDTEAYTAISSYDGWTFENCFAAGKVKEKDHYLQVGSSYSIGSLTSPALGGEGNVVLLIEASRITIPAKFRVSVVGTGTVASTEYTIDSGEEDGKSYSTVHTVRGIHRPAF